MTKYSGVEIAIVGMSGQFPGAAGIGEFWHNLKNGIESIRALTEAEILEEGEDRNLLHHPSYIKANAYIEGKEYFDSAFFGYRPEEATLMDPQLRLFHEHCWKALEDAGYAPGDNDRKTGLFAGAAANTNWQAFAILTNRNKGVHNYTASQLRDVSYLCSRVSYLLNLQGPSLYINTTCSTSLVAIQRACMSLLFRECNMALAGGISILNHSKKGYLYEEGMINSSDGHCRTFDAKASGTVGGEGVGVVVLKRLEDALKDRDHIYALIRGSAVNNDGHDKISFTAPGAEGQYKAILKAIHMAKIEPRSIGYVEAHGTATRLGDPIEVDALNRAFGRSDTSYCALGSVKTNIGHLDTAAGVAGLIKTVLAIQNRQIPPSLHFVSPNPEINFTGSPFYVNASLKDWKNEDYPLRAGVSSFGIGGTNAHVILEEAPAREPSLPGRDCQLLVFSAKTPSALKRIITEAGSYLAQNELNLADAAYTLQTGRTALPYRTTFVCRDKDELAVFLASDQPPAATGLVADKKRPPVIFMFPGQGSQYVDMCYGLYLSEPVFREAAERCFDIVTEIAGEDLRNIVFTKTTETAAIDQTRYTQPALFIIEYALTQLLRHWGITPDGMIGHSLGEYVAACISGVLLLEDALRLVMKRGELMQQAPPGVMMSLSISEKELTPLLKEQDISLAAVNSSELCVVSGKEEDIARFKSLTEAKGYNSRLLRTSHAFHSALMEDILEPFEKEVRKINFRQPVIPYISNTSGKEISAGESAAPRYWVDHLRQTVLFSRGLEGLLKKEKAIFVEVGPGNTLGTFVRSHQSRGKEHRIINLTRHARQEGSDLSFLLSGIGELWSAGIVPDWDNFYGEELRRRIPLPTYSFDRLSYPANVDALKMIAAAAGKSTDKIPDPSQWFYAPSWKLAPILLRTLEKESSRSILLFSDDEGVGDALMEKCVKKGDCCICVKAGSSLIQTSPGQYTIDPSDPAGYTALFSLLSKDNFLPDVIIHGWAITAAREETDFGQAPLDRFLYSLTEIIKNCSRIGGVAGKRWIVLTNDLHPVLEDAAAPFTKALSLGLLNVLSQEYPAVTTSHIDISLPDSTTVTLAEQLYREIRSAETGKVISLRHGKRWEQLFDRVRQHDKTSPPAFKEDGVYMISGGLGSLSFHLCRNLLHTRRVKLVLLGRTLLPLREQWDILLKDEGTKPALKEMITRLRELEEREGEVLYLNCDISRPEEITTAIEQTKSRWGRIDGFIHAAGITQGNTMKPLGELTRSDFDQQFLPKIRGMLLINEALRHEQPDFCLLISSLSTVLGGIGFGAYAPANIYMDYYTQAQIAGGKLKNWKCLDLDGIDFEGMAGAAIGAGEIIEVIERAISLEGSPRLIVSVADLGERIERWVHRTTGHAPVEENTQLPASPSMTEILDVTGLPHVEKEGMPTVENSLGQIWQTFFGRPDIRDTDDFFDIGGDSLKALTMIARIHKTFNIEMTIRHFFDRPTIRQLSAYIRSARAGINEQQPSAEYQPIPPAGIRDYYSLSPEQKRLYFLYETDKTALGYNLLLEMKLSGKPDKQRLTAVFQQLIARHDSLRTSFLLIDGEPFFKIHRQVPFEWEVFEDPAGSAGGEGQAGSIISAFKKPFDLQTAPLFRAGMIKNNGEGYSLLLDIHHIISDAVSLSVLGEEFRELYQGRTLPDVKIQYQDYSEWQHSPSRREKILQQEKYWLGQLERPAPALELPTDFQRLEGNSEKGGLISVYLSRSQYELLNGYILRHKVTLSMLLYSLFGILLSKLSGQENFIVGLSVAGRNHIDLERVVGMFVNALPVRISPQREKKFHQFLEEVRLTTLTAFDNQECPFDTLVEKTGYQRRVGHNPLFDVMFNFEGQTDAPAGLPDEELTTPVYMPGTKRFDLTLNVRKFSDTIRLQFQYDSALFRAETITRLLTYYTGLITSAEQLREMALLDISIEKDEAALAVFQKLHRYTDRQITQEHPDAPTGRTPASYHQERLWFIDTFESDYLYKGAPVYHNIPLIISLEGRLDAAALENSALSVLKKYDIFRTKIVTRDETPFQEVTPTDRWMLKMQAVTTGETDEIEKRIDTEINTPFTPGKPLVRLHLFSVGERKHTLLVILHHLLADRYSTGKLAEEIMDVYALTTVNIREKEQASGIAGKKDRLQYAGFSLWQRECLSVIEPYLLSYWRLYLAPPLKNLELPSDRPRAAIHTYTAGSADLDIPAHLIKEALSYEQRTGIALKILLMAAWKILLHKYSRQNEIVIGTSVDNREIFLPERTSLPDETDRNPAESERQLLQDLIGPVSNLIVLRSTLTESTSFDNYVKELSLMYSNGCQFQAMPFDKLVKELAPVKDMSRTALFDVLFQYEDRQPCLRTSSDLQARIRETNRGYGKYDLNLLLLRDNDAVRGKLIFNADYFDHAKMVLLAARYNELLSNLLASPGRPLPEIGMLPEMERSRLARLFRQEPVGFPSEATLASLFVSQAKRTPDKIAVKQGDRSVTYAALNRRSDQLAVSLKAQGVKSDSLVLLLADRSIEMVTGILAILKAGGAYLPIDIDYPEDRIRYIIDDSQSRVMLTSRNIPAETLFDGVILYLDDEAAYRDPTSAPGPAEMIGGVRPSDLCYVIYTSGTTGNPKGVMIEHRNVVRLLFNDRFQFDFGPDDVWTMFHSHSFDFSVWEIFGALLYGGKLIIIPKMTARDTPRFLKILEEERVTVLNQTPGAFYNLIHAEAQAPAPLLSLRYVIFGGEALAPGKLKTWRGRYPEVSLINMFGITETTVHVTYKEIKEKEIGNAISNIGRPIPTLSAYVLDENHNLVPEDIAGELYIGGEGVARGYWRREALTRERFIPDPFDAGKKLYRSGDLVRILDSGELEYVGRIDNQVQLRGFRIELGEIENQLARYPSIKNTAVLLKELAEDSHLVAYYVSDEDIGTQTLRSFLSASLPEHMVPSYYVHMARLPLTANGKLDRKLLKDPEIKKSAGSRKPVNQLQAELVKIWSEVLGIESDSIGVDMNFFDMGGNSIKIVKLVYRINQQFAASLSVAELFRFPAISLVAELLTGENNTGKKEEESIPGSELDQRMSTVRFLDGIDEY